MYIHLAHVISQGGRFISPLTRTGFLSPYPVTVKIAGLDYIKEAGIKDVVYNSVTIDARQDELNAIKESRIESVLLLAKNIKNFISRGRLDTAKQRVSTAQEIGVTKPIIDTAILDLPSLGAGCNAIYQLKSEVGLPCGSGAHNTVDTWRGLKSKMGKQTKKPAFAVQMRLQSRYALISFFTARSSMPILFSLLSPW